MKIELRPDMEAVNRPNTIPILDEAVVQGATSVHVEMMSEQALWIGIDGADGQHFSLAVTIERVRGQHVLRLRGEEVGGGDASHHGT